MARKRCSRKLSAALAWSALAALTAALAWRAREEPAHSLCPEPGGGAAADAPALLVPAPTLLIVCAGTQLPRCEAVRRRAERLAAALAPSASVVGIVAHSAFPRPPVPVLRGSVLVPALLLGGKACGENRDDAVRVLDDGSVAMCLVAGSPPDATVAAAIAAAFLAAGAMPAEIPTALLAAGGGAIDDSADVLPPPPSVAPANTAAVASPAYRARLAAQAVHAAAWAAHSAALHFDVVILHAPASGLELRLARTPRAAQEALERLAADAAQFVTVSASHRTALFGHVADEALLRAFSAAAPAAGGNECIAFAFDEWALAPVEAVSEAALSGPGGAGAAPPLLFRAPSSADVDDRGGAAEAAGALTAPPLTLLGDETDSQVCDCVIGPIDGTSLGGPALDGDVGRSALHLWRVARAAFAAAAPDGGDRVADGHVCAPEMRANCRCGRPAASAPTAFCAAGAQAELARLVVFVPPPELRPLYIVRRGYAPAHALHEPEQELERACVNMQAPRGRWPLRLRVGAGDTLSATETDEAGAAEDVVRLGSEADVQAWGSLFFANNAAEPDLDGDRGSGAFVGEAAGALVRMARRKLGLSPRRIDRVQWREHGSVASAASSMTVGAGGGSGDVKGLAGEEGAATWVLTLSSSPAALVGGAEAGALSLPERRALARRWLPLHASAARRALAAACALSSSQPRLRVPPHAARAARVAARLLLAANATGDEHLDADGAWAETLHALRRVRHARFVAEALAFDPSVQGDSHMPLVHVLAVYAPLWAPMLLPLLLAITQGLRRVAAKEGRGGPGAASAEKAA